MKNKITRQTEVVANKGEAANGNYKKVDKTTDKSIASTKEEAAKKQVKRSKEI